MPIYVYTCTHGMHIIIIIILIGMYRLGVVKTLDVLNIFNGPLKTMTNRQNNANDNLHIRLGTRYML